MTPPNILYLAWQAKESRRILPVGRLLRTEHGYEFAYIRAVRAAQALGFLPLMTFPDLDEVYRCAELPPLFSNRVMRPSRPDFRAHLAEFALSVQDNEPFTVLARSGGRRMTDELEVFAPPEVTPLGAEAFFLARGVRHIGGSEAALQDLAPGTGLYVNPEPTNPVNSAALLVQDTQGRTLGYVPDYLANELALSGGSASQLQVSTVKVNPDPAPVHHRLLCKYVCTGAPVHPLFTGEAYQPLPPAATPAHAA